MNKRKLKNIDLELSTVSFGGNVFGRTVDENTAFKLLDKYIEKGGNFIDTADVYSCWIPGNKGGESETIIGNWLKHRGKREDVVIASKVGMKMDDYHYGLSRKHILQSIEDSLKRLQTDYVDIYFAHKDDISTGLEETLEAFAKLVKEGKIKVIGASNYKANRLEEALDVSDRLGLPSYQTLQTLYNLCEREDYEKDLEPLCKQKNIAMVSYSSLAKGFLSGKYHSKEDINQNIRGKWVKNYINKQGNKRGFSIVSELEEIALQYNSQPASIALAWLIARPSVTSAIASVSNLTQLDSLIEAMSLNLRSEDIDRLNKVSNF